MVAGAINNSAFKNCSKLQSLVIPNTITTIGNNVFQNCATITNIIIPDTVKSIGNGTFQNCTTISSITIPNSVTSTGGSLFSGCISLQNVTISDEETEISNGTFQNCTSLQSIIIPNSVTFIGNSAFKDCTSLFDVILSNKLITLGTSAFENTIIQNIDFPFTLTFFGNSAFKNTKLTSIIIPNDTANIQPDCFYNSIFLLSISIPSGVSITGNNTFYNIPQRPDYNPPATLYTTPLYSEKNVNDVYKYFYEHFQDRINYIDSILIFTVDNVNYYIKNANATTAYVGVSPLASGYIIIQPEVSYNNKRYPVVYIDYVSFANCNFLSSIKIPNSITSIYDYAFKNCISLSSFVIPDSVNLISDGTFSGCKSLVSISIHKNVKSIGSFAFNGCSTIKNINLPYGLLNIGSYAFQNCILLPYIMIPSSINLINEYTFNGCKSLSSIIIPDNSTYIGAYAFNNCRSLFTIVIPNSVTNIGNMAFNNIPNNNYPNSINAATLYTPFIDLQHFVYNYFFQTFQNKIKYRKDMPIYSNESINYYKNPLITYYNGITRYLAYVGPSPNANGDLLMKVSITDNSGIEYNVKSIYDSAFQDCTFLTSLEIPVGIETIGESAFQSCNTLNTIKIPTSVLSIGRYVFYDCINLYFMYIPSSVISIGEYSFSGIPYNKTIQPTTDKNATTLYTSPLNASNYVYTYLYNLYANKINYVIYPKPVICFKEDTKILTKSGYRPIQELRPGDLIKTIKHGYKAINMIGYREIYNPICEERIKDKLYKCTFKNFPEVFEDLVITGCHSILVDNFKDDEQVEKTRKLLGNIYSTDDKWRLPACIDERTIPYEKEGTFTIYHLALDNDDYYMNYGIYANGLVVETCSKRFLKELAKYQLLE